MDYPSPNWNRMRRSVSPMRWINRPIYEQTPTSKFGLLFIQRMCALARLLTRTYKRSEYTSTFILPSGLRVKFEFHQRCQLVEPLSYATTSLFYCPTISFIQTCGWTPLCNYCLAIIVPHLPTTSPPPPTFHDTLRPYRLIYKPLCLH